VSGEPRPVIYTYFKNKTEHKKVKKALDKLAGKGLRSNYVRTLILEHLKRKKVL